MPDKSQNPSTMKLTQIGTRVSNLYAAGEDGNLLVFDAQLKMSVTDIAELFTHKEVRNCFYDAAYAVSLSIRDCYNESKAYAKSPDPLLSFCFHACARLIERQGLRLQQLVGIYVSLDDGSTLEESKFLETLRDSIIRVTHEDRSTLKAGMAKIKEITAM